MTPASTTLCPTSAMVGALSVVSTQAKRFPVHRKDDS
jgi:hypothetical protein